MPDPRGVWRAQAQQWTRVGSPLRPCSEDIERLAEILAPLRSRRPRALILGVTPETLRLGWTDNSDLLAIDCSYEMIHNVWPGYPAARQGVICANWLAFPLRQSSRDAVVSDGCFGVTRYPGEHRIVLDNVRRLLRPGGLFAFRIFVLPDALESPFDVYEEAMAGRIGSFHAFKLRLLMAYQREPERGVCVGDVWRAWSAEGPGADALARQTGWPAETVRTIDAYREQTSVYTFPVLRDIRNLATAAGFREIACIDKQYELGERCPTLAFTAE